MRKDRLMSCAVLAIIMVFAAALLVVAADIPEEITIHSSIWPEGAKGLKGPVHFTHKKHIEVHKIACTECHHHYEDGKNVWKEGDPVKKCEECHTDPTIRGVKKLPPEQQKLNLKLAFHNNCVGCHKQYKKDHPGTHPPTTCSKCHAKKKK